ncbi:MULTISPECIES: sugar phosphate isomerase/epimerase family protein [Nocardiopsis]|uniref:sugar phosphate isomerase/epimerase family protein n=1 Tax=Nocardiopsis TaxID=2013 RepID=UPI0003481F9E|nr:MULTISPECIES: sugar phosphate isomerase/epimerase family protein [Nocardiopsis]PWV52349.1 sugar phosphate isomerase/epimerase [Nocardiopsis sp. L17-MgMaSL7]
MSTAKAGTERFSLNQATIKKADLATTVDHAVAAGVGAVGLWRDRVAEAGLTEAAARLADSGLRFSSLCRGGFVTDPGTADEQWKENLRALDETAALAEAGAPGSAPVLVLVVGGLPPGDRDLVAARDRVRAALLALEPEARARGVRLGLEPMHPVFCADRAVVSTLGQALDLVADLDPETAGVVVDTYHVWWDPQVLPMIARAGAEGRITSYQVCDWLTPVPEGALLGRGLPGQGHIDFASLTRAVEATGYRGDVEIEVFHQQVWDAPFADVVRECVRAFGEVITPHLSLPAGEH